MHTEDTEALLAVSLINLDATSMKQIAREADGKLELIAEKIFEIVDTRGKMHNPVTNSGGVLAGRVIDIGNDFASKDLHIGDMICPIVSLSLLPLKVNSIYHIDSLTGQVMLDAKAIIFSSTVYGLIPDDMPMAMAVALIDIAGAPARTIRMVEPGMNVVILGAGKAGVLCAAAARQRLGASGRLIMMEVNPEACNFARSLSLADEVVEIDLQNPIESYQAAIRATGRKLFDVVLSVTSALGTEGAAILMSKQGGRVLFFGMATNFQTASLTAEGAGKDVELLMGNGYVPGCVDTAFSLARSNQQIFSWLNAHYV